jgi:hypothetical protein
VALVGELWGGGQAAALGDKGFFSHSVDIGFARSDISVKTFQAGSQPFLCTNGWFNCGIVEVESWNETSGVVHTGFPQPSSGDPTVAWGGSDVFGVTIGFEAGSRFSGSYSGRCLWTLSFWN